MALHLNDEAESFIYSAIESARSLLDNVHCYETEEFEDLTIALRLMEGYGLEEAREDSEES